MTTTLRRVLARSLDLWVKYPQPKIAVAFSGGPDSMALLHLTSEWARTRNVPLLAFVVDHGVRSESHDEACLSMERAAPWCSAVELLERRPDPTSPSGGSIQEQCRRARFELLWDACQRHQVTSLLLAHHADDQAETVALRLARDSGLAGLQGMAVVTPMTAPWHGRARREPAPSVVSHDGAHSAQPLRVLRPVLSVPKSALLEHCREHELAYVTDPSNRDQAFRRARVRRALAAPVVGAATASALLALSEGSRRAESALGERAARLMRRHLVLDLETGIGWIPWSALQEAPPPVAARSLQWLAAHWQRSYILPADAPPAFHWFAKSRAIERALRSLAAGNQQVNFGWGVSMVRQRSSDRVYVWFNHERVAGHFDGRWAVPLHRQRATVAYGRCFYVSYTRVAEADDDPRVPTPRVPLVQCAAAMGRRVAPPPQIAYHFLNRTSGGRRHGGRRGHAPPPPAAALCSVPFVAKGRRFLQYVRVRSSLLPVHRC